MVGGDDQVVLGDDVGKRGRVAATCAVMHGDAPDIEEFLTMLGELDNTLIMVISDNGASAEGGPTGTTNEAQFFNNAQETLEESLAVIDDIGGPAHFNHYPWGWTFAGNTPFRRWKREVHEGGIADPLIVRWPAGISARGDVRDHSSARELEVMLDQCWDLLRQRRRGARPAGTEGGGRRRLAGSVEQAVEAMLHEAVA